jgi:Ca2+-binding EF-hand superfamily protein
MKRTVLLGAALLGAGAAIAVTTAGMAAAQDRRGGMGMDMMFERLDTDGDGRITRAEAAAARAARIAALDSDGDGIVTRDEAVAFARAEASDRAGRRAAAMFDRADADGDGRLTAAELMTGGGMRGGPDIGRMFDRLDRDGDGAITRDEAAEARRGARRGEGRRAMRDGHGPRHDGD